MMYCIQKQKKAFSIMEEIDQKLGKRTKENKEKISRSLWKIWQAGPSNYYQKITLNVNG